MIRHNANLDFLRSCAVFLVLINHIATTLTVQTGSNNAFVTAFTGQIGRAGVLAFFVHTSLVLMYSLERMDQGADRLTLRFYVRRFFRIYPLSIFCVLLVVGFHLPYFTSRAPNPISPRVLLANLLLIQNVFTGASVIAPLWSLPYEVQMYIVLPALYFVAQRRRSLIYLVGLFSIFCALGYVLDTKTGHLNIAAFIPCFLSGVLCYSLRNRIRMVVPSSLWPLFVLVVSLGYGFTSIQVTANYWIGWIYCLLLGLAINAFYDSRTVLLNVIAEKIALYSYGIYLLHVPCFYLIFGVFEVKNLVLGVLLSLSLTMLASVITYRLIESPLITVGKVLSSHMSRVREMRLSEAEA